jgi:RHS repeat-associated protein
MDPGHVDLLQVQQKTSATGYSSLATYGSYVNHQPQVYTDASGQSWAYQYNAAGQPTKVTDPKNEVTTYNYDNPQGGRLLTVIDGTGATVLTFHYPSDCTSADCDLPDSVTDAAGGITTFQYDTFDRAVLTTYPDGSTEAMDYTFQPGDKNPGTQSLELHKFTDRNGHATVYAYDSEGRLLTATDPLNHVLAYSYYANGAINTLTDENGKGHTTTWTLDDDNRVSVKSYADRSRIAYGYDQAGRLQTVTDGLSQVKTLNYNNDDTLAGVAYTNSVNPTADVSFTYDQFFRRRISMMDATGETTYAYYPFPAAPSSQQDGGIAPIQLGANRLKLVTSPVAGTWPLSDGGAPASDAGTADAGADGGVAVLGPTDTVLYDYDELGRVKSRTVNAESVPETLGFDAAGRMTSVMNALDSFTYVYDVPTSRLKQVTSTHGPEADFTYVLPAATGSELLAQLTYSSTGNQLSQFGYSYDKKGNVLTFLERYLGQTFPNPATSTDDGGASSGSTGSLPPPRDGKRDSRLAARSSESGRPSGTAFLILAGGLLFALFGLVRRAAPRARRWAPALAPALLAVIFAACGSGDDTSSGGSAAPGGGSGVSVDAGTSAVRLTTYRYDDADRLLSAAVGTDVSQPPSPQYVYAYDPASNPISIATPNAPTQTPSYTSTNAIADAVYDLNGSPLSLDGNSYAWDAENRLISAVMGGVETDFTYNGDGLLVRIASTGGGTMSDKSYAWSGTTRVAERDNTQASSPPSKRYFDQGFVTDGQGYYYATDLLGSVRQLVDGSGEVRAEYEYDPYGNELPSDNLSSLTNEQDSDFGFAGYFRQPKSGLDLTVYRAYVPNLARWLSRDPLTEAGGSNVYEYAVDNPSSFLDTLGLFEATINDPGGRTGQTYGGTLTVRGNNGQTVSVPASSWPNPANQNPGVSPGTYPGTYSPTGHKHRDNAIRLNNGGAVPTLAPNPNNNNRSNATGIEVHCGASGHNRGSTGCITIDPAYCQRVWNVLHPGESGSINVTRNASPTNNSQQSNQTPAPQAGH